MVAKVFISYRRDDSAGYAGRVHDRLAHEFGSDLLFMDVDSVPLGVNFIKVLRDEVAKCEVLLAVIGPNWLNANDEAGHRRLDHPHDFVRIEIAAALQRNISVIPILLDGATIPKANQLPKDLRELAVRNGLEIRHASFHSDMDKLIRGLKNPSSQVHARAVGPVPPEEHEAAAERNAEVDSKRKTPAAGAEDERQTKHERQQWWPLSMLAMTISGTLALVLVAALFLWIENRPPAAPQQVSVVPSPSATIVPPVAPANVPTPIHSNPIISPSAAPAENANTPPPQAQEKVADASAQAKPPDDSTPINDPALLNEVRERLYELNFDPGALDRPSTEADRQAIREFERQINLPPTGTATMGLLQRLRAIDGLKPWGAIVYSKDNGKWGMAWDEATRKAAVARARVSCGNANVCPVEISFFGTECGVFAYSGTSWAIMARDEIGKAKEAALTDCGKRGKACEVVASVCADGAGRFSSAN
jgi:hypothetical protein